MLRDRTVDSSSMSDGLKQHFHVHFRPDVAEVFEVGSLSGGRRGEWRVVNDGRSSRALPRCNRVLDVLRKQAYRMFDIQFGDGEFVEGYVDKVAEAAALQRATSLRLDNLGPAAIRLPGVTPVVWSQRRVALFFPETGNEDTWAGT